VAGSVEAAAFGADVGDTVYPEQASRSAGEAPAGGGGGEDQHGLAAGDGLAVFEGGVPLDEGGLLHAGVLQARGRGGDVDAAGLYAAGVSFGGGRDDGDLLPGDIVLEGPGRCGVGSL